MVHRLVAESRMMKNCAPKAGVAGARIPKQINKRVVSMGQPHRWPAARSNYNIFAWCRSEVSLAFAAARCARFRSAPSFSSRAFLSYSKPSGPRNCRTASVDTAAIAREEAIVPRGHAASADGHIGAWLQGCSNSGYLGRHAYWRLASFQHGCGAAVARRAISVCHSCLAFLLPKSSAIKLVAASGSQIVTKSDFLSVNSDASRGGPAAIERVASLAIPTSRARGGRLGCAVKQNWGVCA
jgi:hypothetical protein